MRPRVLDMCTHPLFGPFLVDGDSVPTLTIRFSCTLLSFYTPSTSSSSPYSQLQIQRTVHIRPTKITKIFITHAHGDHSFGLPGLLCLMGNSRDRNSPPVEIYGPEGLRNWLRVAIRYSVSRIVPPYRVHELKNIPLAPEWFSKWRSGRFYNSLTNKSGEKGAWTTGYRGMPGEDPESWVTQSQDLRLKPSKNFGEIPGGRYVTLLLPFVPYRIK